MAEIQLTRGMVALVDDADLPLVSGYAWYPLLRSDGAGKGFYASGVAAGSGKSGRKWLLMHHLVLPATGQVDHRDGDGLNNRRENLRPCTSSQNAANARKQMVATSRFKGVFLDRSRGRWAAAITHRTRSRKLGRFVNEVDAAKAYNAAALELFGEFARLNVIEESANA